MVAGASPMIKYHWAVIAGNNFLHKALPPPLVYLTSLIMNRTMLYRYISMFFTKFNLLLCVNLKYIF